MIAFLAALAISASITVNSVPHYGDAVTFTLVYPQEAARQSRQPQYPDNPNVQVDCYQTVLEADGLYYTYHVFQGFTIVDKQTKKKVASGWWQGTTYPVTLHDLGFNGVEPNGLHEWDPSKTAWCGAAMYGGLVDNSVKVWATTSFTVSP